jgi:hypothetical protein
MSVSSAGLSDILFRVAAHSAVISPFQFLVYYIGCLSCRV